MTTKSTKTQKRKRNFLFFLTIALFLCNAGCMQMTEITGSVKNSWQNENLTKIPELNYSEPFNDEITSMLDIEGRWVSGVYSIKTGREAWIIDFKTIGDEFRITIDDRSFMYSKLFVSKVAELMDIDDESIKFTFSIRSVYIPKARTGGGFWSTFLGELGSTTRTSPITNIIAAGIESNIEAQAAKDIAKETKSYFEFKLKLRGNSLLEGTLKTVINESDAHGRHQEVENSMEKYTLFRVPDQYRGAKNQTLTAEEIKIIAEKKRKNEQFKKMFKETIKKKSKYNKGETLNDIGFLFLNGLGVKENVGTAITHFKSAVKKGNTKAMCNIAYYAILEAEENRTTYNSILNELWKKIFEKKFIKKQREAIEWYTKAVEAGEVHAVYMIGLMHLIGLGVEKDFAKAREYLENAEQSGSVVALYSLGEMYHYGWGVNTDYTKAFEYYSLAVDKGYSYALIGLGNLYLNGLGVEKNLDKALEYHYTAAQYGHYQAINAIAMCYYEGEGLPLNYIEAKKWFTLANFIKHNTLKGWSTLDISINDVLNAIK